MSKPKRALSGRATGVIRSMFVTAAQPLYPDERCFFHPHPYADRAAEIFRELVKTGRIKLAQVMRLPGCGKLTKAEILEWCGYVVAGNRYVDAWAPDEFKPFEVVGSLVYWDDDLSRAKV